MSYKLIFISVVFIVYAIINISLNILCINQMSIKIIYIFMSIYIVFANND